MTDTTPEGLDEAEIAVVETVRRFAAERLVPAAQAIDDTGDFVARHLSGLAELGVLGLNLPQAWGGPGVSPLALLACVEAIAGACGSTASMVTAHFLATDSLLLGGDDALRARYLPRAAQGQALGAFALTEPQAGSNPADLRCRAVRGNGGYRLTGTKRFISNGGCADFVVVFAKTDPAAGHRGISAFVVDKGTPGFAAGPPQKTMGLKGGHVFELSFDCEVPEANRIGEAGSGFRTAMRVLDNGRVEVAAMCLGLAQVALDAARDWIKDRVVGGQPLAEYQGVQWMLADMATELRAARLLAEDAARKRDRGQRFTREAAMAKLFASEAAAKVADAALQLHGGYGYTRQLPLERYVRDLRVMRIYEGSSEIQRNIIAREILK